MAGGILKSLLGGGTPQNAQGRRAHSMSDRDAGARDTVYRAPAKKAAPKSGGGGGGGGHKKHSGGGHQRLPGSGQAPIPTPRPNLTLGGTPTAGYEPSVASQLAGVPPDLQDATPMQFPARPEFPDRSVMQTPSSAPGFAPGFPSMTNQPGPETMGPTVTPSAFPTQSPTSVPGPQWPQGPSSAPGAGRGELAALMQQLQQPQQQPHQSLMRTLHPQWFGS